VSQTIGGIGVTRRVVFKVVFYLIE
jgi:hypothetical protein